MSSWLYSAARSSGVSPLDIDIWHQRVSQVQEVCMTLDREVGREKMEEEGREKGRKRGSILSDGDLHIVGGKGGH